MGGVETLGGIEDAGICWWMGFSQRIVGLNRCCRRRACNTVSMLQILVNIIVEFSYPLGLQPRLISSLFHSHSCPHAARSPFYDVLQTIPKHTSPFRLGSNSHRPRCGGALRTFENGRLRSGTGKDAETELVGPNIENWWKWNTSFCPELFELKLGRLVTLLLKSSRRRVQRVLQYLSVT
jgi:hypothetical protein